MARPAPLATPRNSLVRRPSRLRGGGLEALLWLGPSLLLLFGVVVYPVVQIVITSLQTINVSGLVAGFAGLDNYRGLFAQPHLPVVLWNTLVWVVGTVVVTTVVAMGLAALLNNRFPGRIIVRAVVLLPWAASVTITTIGFRWLLNYYYGFANPLFQGLGIISEPIDWLGSGSAFLPVLVFVTAFVSIPFTTYVLLGGMQSIPGQLREAAAIDGAGLWAYFRFVMLPWLRPYLVIATVLNAVWTFNSFPIVWILNQSNPGYKTDVTLTFVYKLAFRTEFDVGMAAAMSVVNVSVLFIMVLFYLRVVEVRDEVGSA